MTMLPARVNVRWQGQGRGCSLERMFRLYFYIIEFVEKRRQAETGSE